MITIQDLEDAGATPEFIIRMAKLAETRFIAALGKAEAQRSKHAKAQARYYSKKRSALISVISTDHKEGPPLSPPNGFPCTPSFTPPYIPPKKLTRTRENHSEEFEIFWSQYPEKVGKAVASLKYDFARKKASAEQLLAGLELYIRTKPDDRNWCHASTWLNQERWLDQPSIGRPLSNSNGAKVVGYIGKTSGPKEEAEIRRIMENNSWS